MSKGVLTVVSGFSGAGKGTVMKRLLEKYENYALSISVTTRKPREGERDGIEYFFRTREEVEAMIQEDQLLELDMAECRLVVELVNDLGGKHAALEVHVGLLVSR